MKKMMFSLILISYSGISYSSDYLEKLNAISEYAEKICNSLPLSGERKGFQLTGKANAELEGLLSKLAELSISGKVNFEDKSFKGVLQKDLKDLFINNADCKNKVSERLEKKLLTLNIEDKPKKPRSDGGEYGAYAFLVKSGNVLSQGWATRRSSKEEAKKIALERCGHAKCQAWDIDEGKCLTMYIRTKNNGVTLNVGSEKYPSVDSVCFDSIAAKVEPCNIVRTTCAWDRDS